MAACIGLLRGVNVGGKQVAMAALRAMLTELGLGGVRTLLNSGNVVFDAGRKSPAKLEALLDAETAERLGLRTAWIIRTATEWDALIAANPYPEAAEKDPAHLVLLALRDAPSTDAADALRATITGRETVLVKGRAAWLVYPDGIGSSKLTLTVIERNLGTIGTARNWNTVRKLAAFARA